MCGITNLVFTKQQTHCPMSVLPEFIKKKLKTSSICHIRTLALVQQPFDVFPPTLAQKNVAVIENYASNKDGIAIK